MSGRPTVVFGLDGAHFELLQPWLDAGHLPHVQRVIESGVSGDLQSVLPPVTSPNWKAYATGKNPGKIGIFWWENVDTDGRKVYYPSKRKHVNKEFWELIAAEDPVGILGVPTTYPPKAVDEFLIAGAPDGENEGYAYPPDLEEQLETEFDYRVIKQNRLDDDRDRAAEEILDLIDLRFRAARHLYRKHNVTFLQATTFYINSLQHFLWDEEYTRRGWEIIDEHLGHFLEDDCDVVLMSDHGSNPIETVFYVNAWLEDQGYLTTETGVANSLYQAGITKDRLVRIATRLGVKDYAKRLAPRSLLRYLPDDEGTVNKEGKTDSVDWDATEAIASGQGPIYLTHDPQDPEYERIRDEIVAELSSLTAPTGNPVADEVRLGEDVYHGRFENEAPDIIIDQAKGVHIPGGIGSKTIFTKPSKEGWRAENKRDGLFAASGPSFRRGEATDLSILDLAPTLLHLNDVSIPAEMDGKVRRDLFAEDSDPATRDVAYREFDGRKRETERIRQTARMLDL